MILEAKNLSFAYKKGGRQILNDFSLELSSGDRVGLSAPSGFGKTTLCKLLAGYLKAGSGEVLLDGKALSSLKSYCPVQLIGQHPELALNPRLKMSESLKDSGAIDPYVLNELGIKSEWLDRYPAELSGGELQRFCIARALSPKTKFILTDEITAMLDLISQAQIWHFLLKKAATENIGLLIVSHSEALLNELCNRRIPYFSERRA